MSTHKPYPSDVTDDEWAFVAPYPTLMMENAPQREYPLHETFNGLRWMARTGTPWRLIANDLPPWSVVYEQAHRWITAGCLEAIVHDLRELPRVAGGCKPQPMTPPSGMDREVHFNVARPTCPASTRREAHH